MGSLSKRVLEHIIRFGFQWCEWGENLRKQEFGLDGLLSESEDSAMIGYSVGVTVTLFLFVLKIMKWSCFISFYHDLRVTLFEADILWFYVLQENKNVLAVNLKRACKNIEV